MSLPQTSSLSPRQRFTKLVATYFRLDPCISNQLIAVEPLAQWRKRLVATAPDSLPEPLLDNCLVLSFVHPLRGVQQALVWAVLDPEDISNEEATLFAQYVQTVWPQANSAALQGFAMAYVVVGADCDSLALNTQLSALLPLKSCLDKALLTLCSRTLLLNSALDWVSYDESTEQAELQYSPDQKAESRGCVRKVLVLGYDRSQTKIYESLEQAGCSVDSTADKVSAEQLNNYDLIVSYGYRYLLPASLLEQVKAPIISLHIAQLPFNRGASPNFWSFFEHTPSGVTIHMIDAGTDSGPLLYQRLCLFAPDAAPAQQSIYDGSAFGSVTFASTYNDLRRIVDELFIDHQEEILTRNYLPRKQQGVGTYHTTKQMPEAFAGWASKISPEIERLHQL